MLHYSCWVLQVWISKSHGISVPVCVVQVTRPTLNFYPYPKLFSPNSDLGYSLPTSEFTEKIHIKMTIRNWNLNFESMITHRQTTGRHDNLATALFHRQPTRGQDHWPTRQVTDIFFKTHRHSPTETFLEKGWKEFFFFNVNIALFSERTHHHFAFSRIGTVFMFLGIT